MIKTLFGWTLPTQPPEKSIIVFPHTSYWEVLVWLLVSKKNMFLLTNPNYYNWASQWIYKTLHLIPSTQIEENQGRGLVSELVKRYKDSDISLLLSPKGTIKKKTWKTGYYYLAHGLGVKIYPLILDYEKRIGYFGEPCDPNSQDETGCKDFLIAQFKKGVEFNLKNVEYERKYDITTQNPYERIFPFDFCVISLLAFVPYLLLLVKHNHYLLSGLGSTALVSSFIYHYRQEGYKKPVENIRRVEHASVYATVILSVFKVAPFYRKLGYSFYLSLLLSYFFLRCGYPRAPRKPRGKYLLYHSIYHLLGGIGMLQLAEAIVYN